MKRENIMASCGLFLLMTGISGCGASYTKTSEYTLQKRRNDACVETKTNYSDYRPQGQVDSMDQNEIPLVDRIAAAKNGTLYCPFKDECQPAVALISVVTPEGLERCSGFLISENQVMTNDHCVSKSVAVQGAPFQSNNIPCDQLIYVHFAKTGAQDQALTISCQSIQARSFESGIASKDYTILKLAQPVRDRAPLKLADRGFAANEKADIYRVQMERGTNNTFDGIQSKLECQSSYTTMLYPGVASANAPLMTFGDCAIQAGNSGSPALNANGEVGALIQGYLSVKQDPSILSELQSKLLDGNYGQVGIGTQTQCIPELNLARSAQCGCIASMNGLMPKRYADLFTSFDSKRLPPISENETWKSLPAPGADEKTFLKVPKCVSTSMKNDSYSTMVMSYRKGINRYLQAEWRSLLEPNERVMNFKLSMNSPSSQVDLENDELGVITLPVCGNEFKPRLTAK